MFGRLISSDNAVKAIFDHYKNFAVAAVVIAVGMSVLTDERTSQLQRIFQPLSGVCICLVGLCLIVLNERHGMRKLREANLHFALHLAVLFVYGFSSIAIIVGLIVHNLR